MDKVGTYTTKHRSKIIANAMAIIRKYQQTREGDGKMNMHVTGCRTVPEPMVSADGGLLCDLPSCRLTECCYVGKFQDIKNGIKGACGPVFIHTDRSKTKANRLKSKKDREMVRRHPS